MSIHHAGHSGHVHACWDPICVQQQCEPALPNVANTLLRLYQRSPWGLTSLQRSEGRIETGLLSQISQRFPFVVSQSAKVLRASLWSNFVCTSGLAACVPPTTRPLVSGIPLEELCGHRWSSRLSPKISQSISHRHFFGGTLCVQLAFLLALNIK